MVVYKTIMALNNYTTPTTNVGLEKRVKALEVELKETKSELAELKKGLDKKPSGDNSSVEAKLDDLIERLGRKMKF